MYPIIAFLAYALGALFLLMGIAAIVTSPPSAAFLAIGVLVLTKVKDLSNDPKKTEEERDKYFIIFTLLAVLFPIGLYLVIALT